VGIPRSISNHGDGSDRVFASERKDGNQCAAQTITEMYMDGNVGIDIEGTNEAAALWVS
jgi:hypothetical protein